MIDFLLGIFLLHSSAQAPWIEEVKPITALEAPFVDYSPLQASYTPPTAILKATTTPDKLKEKIIAELGEEFISIVNCESGFKQFQDGKPLISRTSDVGLLQINQVHWDRAKELGLDIFNSEDDNIAMAKIIKKEQGLKAWSCYNLASRSFL